MTVLPWCGVDARTAMAYATRVSREEAVTCLCGGKVNHKCPICDGS
ncbi:CDGSH-type Zn-finger protein [Streptomyces pseudovenezuelae]|uniref:CDGSH-type Zn-finger protein n=1 Tax=Streptomyces pseudovenezuelae TaxID=67350 RepID=A0ABT6LKK2_9ACTN|nr:CDGSH-type Zn-finger protein [Streptomyces pseudovenezuelae]